MSLLMPSVAFEQFWFFFISMIYSQFLLLILWNSEVALLPSDCAICSEGVAALHFASAGCLSDLRIWRGAVLIAPLLCASLSP